MHRTKRTIRDTLCSTHRRVELEITYLSSSSSSSDASVGDVIADSISNST
ncbi:MAG: hypothetical protein LC101_08545 [Flavobacteriales bacterium]|nr:hypothetical protein [Flavobacteriales bacterium]